MKGIDTQLPDPVGPFLDLVKGPVCLHDPKSYVSERVGLCWGHPHLLSPLLDVVMWLVCLPYSYAK